MSTLLAATIRAVLDKCDTCLNDPRGDGSGAGATPATGDHYTSLQAILREVLDRYTEPASGSPSLLKGLLETCPDLKPLMASAGYRFGLEKVLQHAIDEICDGPAVVVVPIGHFETLMAATVNYAEDLQNGLEDGTFTDGADTVPDLKAALAFGANAMKTSSHAVDDQVIIQAYGEPFDPTKVRIVHHRRSTTQGEVEVFYDGQRIERWFDDIKLQADGAFRGPSDDFWVRAARRWRASRAILLLRGAKAGCVVQPLSA